MVLKFTKSNNIKLHDEIVETLKTLINNNDNSREAWNQLTEKLLDWNFCNCYGDYMLIEYRTFFKDCLRIYKDKPWNWELINKI